MKDVRMSLDELRRSYETAGLERAELLDCPIEQFRKWLEDVVAAPAPDWIEVNAMTLATADAAGHVAARIVLLKAITDEGFAFFTNYESRKGCDLKANSSAALMFYWPHVERQVRIEGVVQFASDSLSDQYFQSRPRGSRISAVISPQSQVIDNRESLEQAVDQFDKQYEGVDFPRPGYWGGYVIKPVSMEFWQGRPNRLHDRFRYNLVDGGWQIDRLGP